MQQLSSVISNANWFPSEDSSLFYSYVFSYREQNLIIVWVSKQIQLLVLQKFIFKSYYRTNDEQRTNDLDCKRLAKDQLFYFIYFLLNENIPRSMKDPRLYSTKSQTRLVLLCMEKKCLKKLNKCFSFFLKCFASMF